MAPVHWIFVDRYGSTLTLGRAMWKVAVAAAFMFRPPSERADAATLTLMLAPT